MNYIENLCKTFKTLRFQENIDFLTKRMGLYRERERLLKPYQTPPAGWAWGLNTPPSDVIQRINEINNELERLFINKNNEIEGPVAAGCSDNPENCKSDPGERYIATEPEGQGIQDCPDYTLNTCAKNCAYEMAIDNNTYTHFMSDTPINNSTITSSGSTRTANVIHAVRTDDISDTENDINNIIGAEIFSARLTFDITELIRNNHIDTHELYFNFGIGGINTYDKKENHK